MTSKRRYHRVRPKGVTVHLETGAGIGSYVVENLSMGGLFLRTPEEEFPVGSHLSFTLMKSGLKRGLQLGAVVAFAREVGGASAPAGVGLRFDELGSSDREKLRQILRDLGLDSPDAPDAQDTDPYAALPDWGDAASMAPPRQSPAAPDDYGKEPPTEPHLRVPKRLAAAPPAVRSPLFDDSKPPPSEEASAPIPFRSAHAGFRPPPKPMPAAQQGPIALPAPAPAPSSEDAAPEPDPGNANMDSQERLMVQIRGLLLQLGETQERLAARENEIAALKEEVQRLTQELEKANPKQARRR